MVVTDSGERDRMVCPGRRPALVWRLLYFWLVGHWFAHLHDAHTDGRRGLVPWSVCVRSGRLPIHGNVPRDRPLIWCGHTGGRVVGHSSGTRRARPGRGCQAFAPLRRAPRRHSPPKSTQAVRPCHLRMSISTRFNTRRHASAGPAPPHYRRRESARHRSWCHLVQPHVLVRTAEQERGFAPATSLPSSQHQQALLLLDRSVAPHQADRRTEPPDNQPAAPGNPCARQNGRGGAATVSFSRWTSTDVPIRRAARPRRYRSRRISRSPCRARSPRDLEPCRTPMAPPLPSAAGGPSGGAGNSASTVPSQRLHR